MQNSATPPSSIKAPPVTPDIRAGNDEGDRLYAAGKYLEARDVFLATAAIAERRRDFRSAAMNWSNAGVCEIARLNFRGALADFLRSEQIARVSRQPIALASAMNNLATLHLQMGDPAAALEVASEALASPAGISNPKIRPKLRFQLASSLARLHRFPEARSVYRAAIDELETQGDFDAAARALASLGNDALDAGLAGEAEAPLAQALRLIEDRRLTPSANVLRGLARVRVLQGYPESAATLFDSAIAAPQRLLPPWLLYADRGEFRLSLDDLPGALADFRQARKLASFLRADIVPADQDRIALEGGLSRVASGLIDAGNRLAMKSPDPGLLQETFDVAETDRLWSLRALVPAPDDWRTRLPATYWDRLAQYQNIERALLSQPSPRLDGRASSLNLVLQKIEAAAGADTASRPASPLSAADSPLSRARALLGADAVWISFHVAERRSWVWAVDSRAVEVRELPSKSQLIPAVAAFADALSKGNPAAPALGSNLYRQLFGQISPSYLAHRRWLLELDGPLFDLPFGALVVSYVDSKPVYLLEHAALQAVPGALMPRPAASPGGGWLLGIGDPVYNAADSRYTGSRIPPRKDGENIALTRLSGTAGELDSVSRAWTPGKSRLLTGAGAGIAGVESALQFNPSVIHFATHVLAGPGQFSSGLIALSLDQSGALGLLGPREIIAHPVTASLVVLNGCHSAQGETLPGAGLMGLTRAWIGAGAGAVLATRWDIPDEARQTMMTAFYRELSAHWEQGPAFALQQAELEVLKSRSIRNKSNLFGAYFLLGRV